MASNRRFTVEEALDTIFGDSDSEMEEEASGSESESASDTEINMESASEGEMENSIDDFDTDMSADEENLQRARGARHGIAREREIEWEFYEDIDPFESTWLQNFEKRPGILVDASNYVPVDFFYLFFPNEAFELISRETNRYAQQYLDTPADFEPCSRFRAWKDTSPNEIKAFFALQIAMGLCQKPAHADYWSGFWLTALPFSSVMSRNRFELLQAFLHFNNIENQIARGEEGYNPLFKIQPLLDIVNPTYEKWYQPARDLSLDESMVKFKGRLFFRQYLPAKPTRWGIKQFVLAEAKTGYCLRSIVYTGKASFPRYKGVSLSEQVVLSLVQGYEDKGHIVYMDNYYSAPSLFKKLEQENIGACGTVKVNRKQMPKELLPSRLSLKKGELPVFMRSDNLVACAWQDTKRVTFLSTVENNLTVDKAVRSKNGEGGYREVEKPVIADRYNSNMGGVDTLDQMLGTYQFPHKCVKWYHTLFHRAREIALVNGFILYKKANSTKRVNPKKFREQVITGLLRDWNPPQPQNGRPSDTPDPLRLTGRHFLGKNENPKQKLDCRVCSDRKNKKRVQTSFYCKQCDIALCIVPCFERYHTLRQYNL